jgi:hypothetical protein
MQEFVALLIFESLKAFLEYSSQSPPDANAAAGQNQYGHSPCVGDPLPLFRLFSPRKLPVHFFTSKESAFYQFRLTIYLIR